LGADIKIKLDVKDDNGVNDTYSPLDKSSYDNELIDPVYEGVYKVDIHISGFITIDCYGETAELDFFNSVTLKGSNTDGNCVHDSFANNGITLKSIT